MNSNMASLSFAVPNFSVKLIIESKSSRVKFFERNSSHKSADSSCRYLSEMNFGMDGPKKRLPLNVSNLMSVISISVECDSCILTKN